MKTDAGLTLHELLISLTILSIIAALSVPNFSHFIHENKMDVTTGKFFRDLTYARASSINYNANITVCASENHITCKNTKDWSKNDIIIMMDNNGNLTLDGTDRLLKVINFASETSSILWSSFGNRHYLQWIGSGGTYYQNGNFTLCPKNKDLTLARKIILNAAGRLYYGLDRNKDGIQEGTDEKNLSCI